jgi:hypothetical protein
MKSKEKVVVDRNDIQKQPKKPYQTPQLILHGTIEKITGGTRAGRADGMTGIS